MVNFADVIFEYQNVRKRSDVILVQSLSCIGYTTSRLKRRSFYFWQLKMTCSKVFYNYHYPKMHIKVILYLLFCVHCVARTHYGDSVPTSDSDTDDQTSGGPHNGLPDNGSGIPPNQTSGGPHVGLPDSGSVQSFFEWRYFSKPI